MSDFNDDFDYEEELIDDEDISGQKYSYNYDENDYEFDDEADSDEDSYDSY